MLLASYLFTNTGNKNIRVYWRHAKEHDSTKPLVFNVNTFGFSEVHMEVRCSLS